MCGHWLPAKINTFLEQYLLRGFKEALLLGVSSVPRSAPLSDD